MAKRLQVAALLSFPRACTGLFLSERTSTGVSQFCRVVHTAPKTVTLSTLGERLALSDSSRDKEASSILHGTMCSHNAKYGVNFAEK